MPTRRDVLILAGFLAAAPLAVNPAARAATPPLDTPAARAALRAALEANIVKTKAPAVLRLVFHDSGTFRAAPGDGPSGGMNASVRYELAR